jgi:hypothetical protein
LATPQNQVTLTAIYNAEVAVNLLRKYIVTQDQPSGNAAVWTVINSATAVQANMVAQAANWSLLP